MAKSPSGYSSAQIGLHWAVVVLVAFQFLAHAGIEASWIAFMRGETTPPDAMLLAYLHVAAGTLVLILAMIRIYLRRSRGTPPPVADDPRLLHLLAEAVHGAIYVLLFLLPITGAIAWFFGVSAAAGAHDLLQKVLLGAIALHISGALFQHFVRRSDVVMRMLRPDVPRE
jgi:cytochrome b561